MKWIRNIFFWPEDRREALSSFRGENGALMPLVLGYVLGGPGTILFDSLFVHPSGLFSENMWVRALVIIGAFFLPGLFLYFRAFRKWEDEDDSVPRSAELQMNSVKIYREVIERGWNRLAEGVYVNADSAKGGAMAIMNASGRISGLLADLEKIEKLHESRRFQAASKALGRFTLKADVQIMHITADIPGLFDEG